MKGTTLEDLNASLHRLGRLLSSRQVASRISTAANVDVNQQGATLLRSLLRDGRQSVNTLASAAAMDLGAVSRQVRVLEEAGLVRRRSSPDDARVALLELTAKGRRMAERLRAVSLHHIQEAVRGWTDADGAQLTQLLERLVDDLIATPVTPEAALPKPHR